ncbi:MAG TPA: FAD-dependent monooxygenase [Novosphingobium sp.]|nr:FAD-dependent monooxygenase [Novosphingobium sp.]
MTTKKRVQVVVAGAGPVGSVAAMYLAMNGVDVVLAETGPDNAADLRASTFHPPTLEMLDQLKVTDFLLETGLKAPVYHWRDRKTGEILPFDFAELAGDTKYPFRLQCEQYHLSRKLSDRLAEEPHAEILFNHRLVWFQQDDDGVDVALETPMGIEHIRADYLIGADGASSIVRKWLGVEFDGFTYPERFLCLSTEQEIRDEIPDLAYVNYVSDADEWMVLLRVPTLWRVLVPANEETNEELLSDEKKTRVFNGFLKDGASVQTRHRTIYRVHQRVAKSFRENRVLLVGDAAHLNNPLGGFGMNSGVHDAFNLCERLVDVLKGGDDATLDQFDRQRRTVTHAFTQAQTIENMEIMRGGQGEAHARRGDRMRALLTDDDARRQYLLRQSMIGSLRDAAAIA